MPSKSIVVTPTVKANQDGRSLKKKSSARAGVLPAVSSKSARRLTAFRQRFIMPPLIVDFRSLGNKKGRGGVMLGTRHPLVFRACGQFWASQPAIRTSASPASRRFFRLVGGCKCTFVTLGRERLLLWFRRVV